MYLTGILADHICSVTQAARPASIDEMALRCILDLLGAAIAGAAANGPAATRQSVQDIFGPGTAPIWMSGRTASPVAALICNAAAASALDLDDGHRAARGHPGACVIPTVLTLASQTKVTGRALLSAIIAGYDIGVRIAAAQNPDGIPTRQSGRWAAFAAVAAAGSLFGASTDHVAQALAIAGVLAPNQQANGSSGYSRLTGNDVKEGIAWSAATGLTALHLAMNGHTGPADLLDHPGYYDRERILDRLGDHWEIGGTYFKLYACCRYIHAPVDALLAIMIEHALVAEEITCVTVDTFGWALRLGNKTNPENLVDIQYSLPYCLAVTAIHGPAALAPVDVRLLNRSDLSRFAERVRIKADPEFDRLFPHQTLARVTVETTRGSFRSPVAGPVGGPARPLAFGALGEKFLRVTRGVISPRQQETLINAVLRLLSDDGRLLLDELGSTRSSLRRER
jgi:2-methylcitrate dehydratase PrpD